MSKQPHVRAVSALRPGERDHVDTVRTLVPRVRTALEAQAHALSELASRIDASFDRAVAALCDVEGHVVVTGIGKSGIVARKLASTLSSLGTPSFFLHAGEALHGDLGAIGSRDAVIFVSHSGMTDEVLRMLPRLHELRVPTIALVGDGASPLARAVDVAIGLGLPAETCPLQIAPTTSSLSALAVGDALACMLAEQRGISRDDFRSVHPGGQIGRRLAGRTGPAPTDEG